jgi:hypothetical protein
MHPCVAYGRRRTYVLIRDGLMRSGAFDGTHNNAYGVVVHATLHQENLALVVQENTPIASARFYDAATNVAGGFDQCTGAAMTRPR